MSTRYEYTVNWFTIDSIVTVAIYCYIATYINLSHPYLDINKSMERFTHVLVELSNN